MSELVAKVAVQYLRATMFPALPADVQQKFPRISDPLLNNPVPNIVVGQYQDYGANAAMPIVTAYCEGAAEGIVNVYRHLTLHVEPWISAATLGPNVDGRTFLGILYEYIFRCLQNTNWGSAGNKVGIKGLRIERCYEIERSPLLFEPQNKIYHLSNSYRVEALSSVWY